jgi:pyruvate carboxylase subunit B
MKYIVDLNGERHEVELDGSTATVSGVQTEAQIHSIEGTPVSLLTMGDEVRRIIVRRTGGRGRYRLSVEGYRFEVEALDERARAIRDITSAAAKPSGPAPLIAPMPGLIVRVDVSVGDRVQAGQAIVVMEAMKMENALRASTAGTVRALHASPGEAVEKGAVLVELE